MDKLAPELVPEASNSTPQHPRGPLFYIGAAGLLTMIVVETLSVLGRHLGAPLLGSIEIMQAAILVSACAAIVLATLQRAHATVHLIVDRCSEPNKRRLAVLASLLSAIFFIGLAMGAIWLCIDFWNAHEHSELLQIPFRPLRALVALTALSVAGVFFFCCARALRSHA